MAESSLWRADRQNGSDPQAFCRNRLGRSWRYHYSPIVEIIFNPFEFPKAFESLVLLYPPRAIRTKLVHMKTMEMVDALTLVAELSNGQLAYLDTLSVLVEYYQAEMDCWTKAKR